MTQGSLISSRLSGEITLQMLLIFTLPAGLFCKQHAEILGKQEGMASPVLRAELTAWQRLGRGRFLKARAN